MLKRVKFQLFKFECIRLLFLLVSIWFFFCKFVAIKKYKIMKKKYLLIALLSLFAFQNSVAQLPNGSIAPNFSLTDLDGTVHKLYEDYTDLGYTVFIDFSAIWCPPCWSYHQSHALKDVYENHGPSGHPGVNSTTTNDVMVFFIEGQEGTIAELNGGSGSQGDWVAGTPYPIICTDPASGFGNSASISNDWAISGWPTIYQVCPDRTLTVIGQAQGLYSLVTACLPPPSHNNDARSFMNNSANSGCSSVTPEISIQNYGLSALTSVKIDVSLNNVFQYTINWAGNLSTLDVEDVLLNPLTGLVNNDLITIDVTTPNGVTDANPQNNQTISYIVDLGFDNAYWDGDLSIDVSGGSTNSWYLKQVSNNLVIASGFGGVTGSNNFFPLNFNECYTLQSIDGGGETYTVTDFVGNVVLDGTVTGVEDFDNFTTGDEMWTAGVNDNEISNIAIYPIPVKDKLYIDSKYDNLRIIDLLGKEVLQTTYSESIDVSNLSDGIYLLELKIANKKVYQKVEVAK